MSPSAETVDEKNRWFGEIERIVEYIELTVSQARELAVMMIFVHDVDKLCATAGHSNAREILDEFYRRLYELPGKEGMVGQLSDRKFALLLNGFRNQGHVQLAAQKIQRLIRTSSEAMPGANLHATIGIALVPAHYKDANEALRCAEIALLDGRRNNQPITFYEVQTADRMISEWNLEQKLAEALEAGDLELHYQPKLELGNMQIIGMEALVRWHDAILGQISPDMFVGLAESSGLIKDLTHFSIQRACRQLNHWKQSVSGLTVAINITPSIIRDLEIVDLLESATRIWSIEPETIVLEVTENALMVDPETSHRILGEIRNFGARVSIDDFGTGYSFLAYLKDIPADELKIDRSFVMNMLTDSEDRKIVEHAISIAGSFGLQVVAEGVSDAETMSELRALGCDQAQGHYICRPLSADRLLSWYQKQPRGKIGSSGETRTWRPG